MKCWPVFKQDPKEVSAALGPFKCYAALAPHIRAAITVLRYGNLFIIGTQKTLKKPSKNASAKEKTPHCAIILSLGNSKS